MTSRRILSLLLAIGLLASLYVAIRRERHEHAARTVEIVMDDADFSAFARSYGYDQRALLAAMHAAGLTSLAVSEELGTSISSASTGALYPGGSLMDQARMSRLDDPLFAGLAAAHALRDDTMYLIAYDAPTAARRSSAPQVRPMSCPATL